MSRRLNDLGLCGHALVRKIKHNRRYFSCAFSITSKMPSSTTGTGCDSLMNSMMEHWLPVEDPELAALGRGSSNPSPMFSGPTATLSASRARSIAEGCRRTWVLVKEQGDEAADTGVKRDVRSDDGVCG